MKEGADGIISHHDFLFEVGRLASAAVSPRQNSLSVSISISFNCSSRDADSLLSLPPSHPQSIRPPLLHHMINESITQRDFSLPFYYTCGRGDGFNGVSLGKRHNTMQRLSYMYLTETVLTNKIIKKIIVLSFKSILKNH